MEVLQGIKFMMHNCWKFFINQRPRLPVQFR